MSLGYLWPVKPCPGSGAAHRRVIASNRPVNSLVIPGQHPCLLVLPQRSPVQPEYCSPTAGTNGLAVGAQRTRAYSKGWSEGTQRGNSENSYPAAPLT